MSRSLAGNLRGKAAQGVDDINSSIPKLDIFDELTESLKFTIQQRNVEATFMHNPKLGHRACKMAMELHKRALGLVDQINMLALLVGADGSDSSMSAQLTDAGFGSGGVM